MKKEKIKNTEAKTYSQKVLFWVTLWMGIFCILIDLGIYYALKITSTRIIEIAIEHQDPSPVRELVHTLALVIEPIRYYFVPVSATAFTIFTLLIWLCLYLSFQRLRRHSNRKITDKDTAKGETKAARRQKDQRMFLHLLTVLQREGRLLDFFSEEIEEYEDEQIGSAVRSIHEKCNQVLKKYLKVKPIVDTEEEEELTVAPGFDTNSIKLIGKVTGEPPFKGIVRHRGWKAINVEPPTLSGNQDALVIAPAELEVV